MEYRYNKKITHQDLINGSLPWFILIGVQGVYSSIISKYRWGGFK